MHRSRKLRQRVTTIGTAALAVLALGAAVSSAAPSGTNGTTCDPYYGPVGTPFPANYTGTCTRSYRNGKSCSTNYVNGQIVSSTCPAAKTR